jgi:hypothetical protein
MHTVVAASYFPTVVTYSRKMFMKLIPRVEPLKLQIEFGSERHFELFKLTQLQNINTDLGSVLQNNFFIADAQYE